MLMNAKLAHSRVSARVDTVVLRFMSKTMRPSHALAITEVRAQPVYFRGKVCMSDSHHFNLCANGNSQQARSLG
jgi:hypothetical protein